MMRLHMFWFSHFNEKVRWAFAYKGIPYEARTVSPGDHMPIIKKLSGQTSTPVLEADGQVLVGSTKICVYLEDHFPERPLLPKPIDAAERAKVLEVCDWFDATVGKPHRQALFQYFFDNDPAALAALWSTNRNSLRRLGYTLGMPVFRAVISNMDNINAETARAGEESVRTALDRIVKDSAATGFLCGSQFSLADLTAAALLFPLAEPPELSFDIPAAAQPALKIWADRFREHAGVRWIEKIFREYGPRAERRD